MKENSYSLCIKSQVMAARDPPFNLNNATEAQLKTLHGVGQARAKSLLSIIRNRGPFDNLQNVNAYLDPGMIQALSAAYMRGDFDLGQTEQLINASRVAALEEADHLRAELDRTLGQLREARAANEELVVAKARLLELEEEREELEIATERPEMSEEEKELENVKQQLKAMEVENHELRVSKERLRRIEEENRVLRSVKGKEEPLASQQEPAGGQYQLTPALAQLLENFARKELEKSEVPSEEVSDASKIPEAADNRGQTGKKESKVGSKWNWPGPRLQSTPLPRGEVDGARYIPQKLQSSPLPRGEVGDARYIPQKLQSSPLPRGEVGDARYIPQKSASRSIPVEGDRQMGAVRDQPRKSSLDQNNSFFREAAYDSYSSSSDEEETPHYRVPEYRSPVGKIPTYDGKVKWDIYEEQFRRISRKCGWGKEAKLDNLVQHLRDDALTFYGTLSRRDRKNYSFVKGAMRERFNQRNPPTTARRELQSLRQNIDETLESFAQRCQALARDGFSGDSERTIERAAMDAFLNGCSDRRAALLAGEKDLHTMRDLVRSVKHSIHNAKAILGDRKIRGISFAEENPQSRQTSQPPKVGLIGEDMQKELQAEFRKILMSALADLQPNRSTRPPRSPSPYPSQSRSRSASPKSLQCYNCKEEGHFARECPKAKHTTEVGKKTPIGKPLAEN